MYDPSDEGYIDEDKLADGLQAVMVPPPWQDRLTPRDVRPVAQAIMTFLVLDSVDAEHLVAACERNLTFLQYISTLC